MKSLFSVNRVALSPAVRQLLDTHQLIASNVPSTGPHGRLLKGYAKYHSEVLIQDCFQERVGGGDQIQGRFQKVFAFKGLLQSNLNVDASTHRY